MYKFDKLCRTCLSENRNLTPARLFASFFKEINITELPQPLGGVCWECHRLIMKFNNFKLQVQMAQQVMNQKVPYMQTLSNLTQQFKCTYDYIFSYNSDPLKHDYDSEYIKREAIDNEEVDCKDISIHDEYLVDDNEIIETNNVITAIGNSKNILNDIHDVNVEDDNERTECDNIINAVGSNDNNPIIINKNEEEINTEVGDNKNKIIRVEKEIRGRVKEERDSIAQDDFEEKFDCVVLSETEMVRNREEKRNHPNFKKVPYKCDTCVVGFLRKENYELHIMKKHDENIGPYTCQVCNIRFPNLRSMDRHKAKHYALYRCKLCKYETSEMWSAINHCKVKHRGDCAGSIHCTQCVSVHKTPEDLELHMRRDHSLRCNECGGKFKGKNTLRSHKARVHAVKREYSCEFCRKCFKSQSRLESHMAGHGPAAATRLSYCSVCDIQYKNLHVYRSHLKNSANHAQTLYPCPECDKKFASKVYWTKHYNFYHLHKSQYKCEVCAKLFISAWKLKNHKQKYHGMSRPRDHSCNVCGKKFFTLPTLRGHMLTHSEERKYMCEDCGDTFKQRPALYTHSRLVHKGGRKEK